MSDATNIREAEVEVARELIFKYLNGLTTLVYAGHEENGTKKRVVGLVGLVTYEDGTVYPHAVGAYSSAKIAKLCDALMTAEMSAKWEEWCRKAKSVTEEGEYATWHADPKARRILEGGL